MTRQERWNLKHKNNCKKSQRKYMKKIYWEAKMYRRLKKAGRIIDD